MDDDRRTPDWSEVIGRTGEQQLLDELAVAYMEKHGAVAVRDNHDGTIDFIPEDGHVYVLAARRKYPEVTS